MTYKKQYNGGTFGPNMKFEDRCYFENCTFLAQCTFGEACDFVNCNFQKCCPKPYSNPNSEIKKGSKLFNCSLEYVTIESGSELYNEKNSGNRVIIQSTKPKNTKQTKGGDTKIKTETNCGQRVDSKEVKKDKKFWHCGKPKVEGYSDVKATINSCGCPK